MKATPCERNPKLQQKVEEFAEILKTQAHQLGDHGLSEQDFYNSGLFRGAIEQIRGEYSATMTPKREFVSQILNHMVAQGYVRDWTSAGSKNRHDYSVTLLNGKTAIIELKGALDGNNTNIFSRPPHADEFIIWSIASSPTSDPAKNLWSGIHTRLSAEMIHSKQRIDGVVLWDWICGTLSRPCPKVMNDPSRLTEIGPYRLPPPCIYMFPATIPSPRNNPSPRPQALSDVGIIDALHRCFGGKDDEVHSVFFSTQNEGNDVERKTRIELNGELRRESKFTTIKRD
jgi:hypothetical protein